MRLPRTPSIPSYVAIITDGNGRWARRRGLPVWEGHRAGAETLRNRIYDAIDLGIAQLTVYAFSTENWTRDEREVGALMEIVHRYVERETLGLHAADVQVRFIGRRGLPLPRAVIDAMNWAEHLTARNTGMTLFIPINYGGRAEIVDAARTFSGTTEDDFRRHLYAPDLNDPDIVIRTGGEHRLSNYLLWQTAGTHLVVRPELWPDFDRQALEDSLTLASRS